MSHNQPFMSWHYLNKAGQIVYAELVMAVATRSDALRILEAWDRYDVMQRRADAACARIFNGEWRSPDNRGSKKPKNVTLKRMGRYWNAETYATRAWCRAVEVCQKLGVDACFYDDGGVPDPMYDSLCDAIRAVMKAQRRDSALRHALTVVELKDGEWRTLITLR